MNELNMYQQAAGHIGKTYGIKKIVGIIENPDNELNFHTKCVLCQQITDVQWTRFLNNQNLRFSCTACGATITYNKSTPPAKEEPKEKSTPEPKVHHKPAPAQPKRENSKAVKQPPVEVLPAEPETPEAVSFDISKYPALVSITNPEMFSEYRYNKYAVLVGETVSKKIITGIRQINTRMMYTFKCEECGTESKMDCSTVVNTPEKVPYCRCSWVRKGVKQPKPGDIIQGFEVINVHKGTTSHTEWFIDCKCPDCGNIKGFTIKEIITPGSMICGHKGSGYIFKKGGSDEPNPDDDGDSSPLVTPKTLSQNLQTLAPINPVSQMPKEQLVRLAERNAIDNLQGDRNTIRELLNQKFPIPVIKHYNSPDIFDEIDANHPLNRHLYAVYRSMIYRAKMLRLSIALEWYDPEIPTINNADGFQKFFIWSHRSGYVESPSHSMRNITQLRRLDEAYGFNPDNCYWKMINS